MRAKRIVHVLGQETRGYLRLVGAFLRLAFGSYLLSIAPWASGLFENTTVAWAVSVLCALAGVAFVLVGIRTVVRGVRDIARGEKWLTQHGAGRHRMRWPNKPVNLTAGPRHVPKHCSPRNPALVRIVVA